jgi:hypothetical protein
MNLNNPGWEKLVTVARGARDDRPVTPPYGFATRVAALAMADEVRPSGSLFERWSWRALAVAGTFAAVTVAASYSSLTSSSLEDDLMSDDYNVTALFD